jgi:hypothetical protein
MSSIFGVLQHPLVGDCPASPELISQLHHAGFQDVQTIRLIPGEELFAFKALPGENA